MAGGAFGIANIKNRMHMLHYAEANKNEIKARCAKHVTVEDFMLQPFKSCGEFGRSLVRLMTSKAAHETTRADAATGKQARFVMVPGD